MNDSFTVAENPTRCDACGATINAGRLEGLCPACTWKALTEAADPPGGAEPAPSIGKGLFRVPNHVIVEEIARGGMGIVYRARQSQPARMVALKMLLPHQAGSAAVVERFRLEIQTVASLEHPAILPVYEVGDYEGMPYFTMQLASGGTLIERIAEYRSQFRQIAELMAAVAGAVQFAHERGVLHRDIKPGNILFDEAGRAYVADFGLAKLVDEQLGGSAALTDSVHLLGTPPFVAPELVAGKTGSATTAADVYGLGAVLYQLLTGEPPFQAESFAALCQRIITQEPAAPSALAPGVPRDLEVICLKCLAKDPSRRYASARELAEDLQRWLQGRPILARPVAGLERARRWAARNPVTALLSALLLGSVLVGGALLVRANHQLNAALKETQAAYAAARQNLYSALLVQSRLMVGSGDPKQREQALEIARKLGQIKPGPEVRTEAAAALALSSEPNLPPPVFTRFIPADDHRACTLDVTRDGRYLVTGTLQGVALWDTESRTQLWSRAEFAFPWTYVGCPPDGSSFLYSARNYGIQRSRFSCRAAGANVVADVSEPELVGRATDATIIGFNGPANDWLVAADRTGLYISRIEVWPQGRPEQARIVASGEAITFFSLSPDQAWGASTTLPGTDVRLWDARQAKSIGFLQQTNAIICEFSPDSRRLIARLPEHYGVWETGTWRLLKEWPITFGGWNSSRIVYSHHGRWLAAPLGGNRFQLLAARDFSELCTLTPPLGFEALSAVWSPDDRKLYLLDGGHRIYEWDIAALRAQLAALNLDWQD